MAADHFQPWVPEQGQASYVWNVLSALGQRTPGRPRARCHLPDVPPPPGDRRAGRVDARGDVPRPHLARPRLRRGAQRARVRRLLAGGAGADHDDVRGDRDHQEAVHRQGRQAQGRATSGCTRPGCGRTPRAPPPILVATAGPITAKKTGARCDGIITPGATDREGRGRAREVRRGGDVRGQGPRSTMPKLLQLHLSWAPTDEEAMDNAITRVAERRHEVPQAGHPLAARLRGDGRAGTPGGLRGADGHLSRTPTTTGPRSSGSSTSGITQIYLHNVGRNQAEWIEVFGRDVLPKLNGLAIRVASSARSSSVHSSSRRAASASPDRLV